MKYLILIALILVGCGGHSDEDLQTAFTQGRTLGIAQAYFHYYGDGRIDSLTYNEVFHARDSILRSLVSEMEEMAND